MLCYDAGGAAGCFRCRVRRESGVRRVMGFSWGGREGGVVVDILADGWV